MNMENKRSAVIERNTKETQIKLTLDLDGNGDYSVQTGVGFLDHMLELFTRHGLFNLQLQAKGDIYVDYHHLVEDVGICLGKAFSNALGDCAGIKRYASITLPMDESLVSVAVDIGGRPCLVYNVPNLKGKVGEFDIELVEEFFRGFVTNAKINLHIDLIRGENLHHIAEAIFKGTSRALRTAVEKDSRIKGIPSTKGIL
jgi:imidazoleglycerol-phosphate dehydratase